MDAPRNRTPMKPFKIDYDPDTKRFSIEVKDKTLYPFSFTGPNNVKRTVEYKEGKKGDSLFMN